MLCLELNFIITKRRKQMGKIGDIFNVVSFVAKGVWNHLEDANMKGLNRYTVKYREWTGNSWLDKTEFIFSESEKGAISQLKSRQVKDIKTLGVKRNNNK